MYLPAVRRYLFSYFAILLTVALFPGMALTQDTASRTAQTDDKTFEGTIVSTSRETLVVRTDDNDFQLFVFNQDTTKPRALASGSRVRVVSSTGDQEGSRLATSITVLSPPSDAKTGNAQSAAPPPREVKNLEKDIRDEARRWRLGVRTGAALDPELFMFGVHTQIGPIFNKNVIFRPNAEFAFGEVTDLIALNLEAIYRLPVAARGRTWNTYFGAGPAFTFIHQNFERTQGQGRDIDFGNFDYETGFNVLAGIQRRHTFFEVKTSLYSKPAPTLRLILGYNF
jgi:hypothetical protein